MGEISFFFSGLSEIKIKWRKMKITNFILGLKLLSFLVGPDSAKKGEFYVNFQVVFLFLLFFLDFLFIFDQWVRSWIALSSDLCNISVLFVVNKIFSHREILQYSSKLDRFFLKEFFFCQFSIILCYFGYWCGFFMQIECF